MNQFGLFGQPAMNSSTKPRAWRYMAGALVPKRRHHVSPEIPELSIVWQGCEPEHEGVDAFVRLCGLRTEGAAIPNLFLHALAFRAQTALLAHPKFPAPIWQVLQVRNELTEFTSLGRGQKVDIRTSIHALRAVAKGLEAQLRTTVTTIDQQPIAESVNTFFYRGRMGTGTICPVPQTPAAGTAPLKSWFMPGGGGLDFGRLTGDYNGIHLFDTYARAFGFPRAFFHPLRIVARAMQEVGFSGPHQTQLWFKGPVLHDSHIQVKRGADIDPWSTLSIHVAGDPRAAILIRTRSSKSRDAHCHLNDIGRRRLSA